MAEPWIRVHANLVDKPVVDRAVHALGVTHHEAIGLLVQFWGAVSQYATEGLVGQRTDRQLEMWAGWSGRGKKPGRFAQFIRTQHLDGDGCVNEWDEYAGKLESRRAAERERKRLERERKERERLAASHAESHADNPADIPPTVTRTVQPARANEDETLRNEELQQASSSAGANGGSWRPVQEASLAERLASDADRTALTALVARSGRKLGVVASVAMYLDGGEPLQPTPVEMGVAIRDFNANGCDWNAALFRKYVRRAIAAERSPPGQPESPYRTTPTAPGPGERSYLAGKAALEGL
jgi:hypothetical protein